MTPRESRALAALNACGWQSGDGWRGPVTGRWLVIGRQGAGVAVSATLDASGRVRALAVASTGGAVPVGILGTWLSTIAGAFADGDVTGRGGIDYIRGPGGIA